MASTMMRVCSAVAVCPKHSLLVPLSLPYKPEWYQAPADRMGRPFAHFSCLSITPTTGSCFPAKCESQGKPRSRCSYSRYSYLRSGMGGAKWIDRLLLHYQPIKSDYEPIEVIMKQIVTVSAIILGN